MAAHGRLAQDARPFKAAVHAVVLFFVLACLGGAGCGSNGGAESSGTGGAGGQGSGGTTSSGGQPGSGGMASSGGQSGSGGMAASGGQPGSGGMAASGGQPGSGGMASSGGQPGGGGMAASGGQPGSGGMASSGGQPGSGGMAASGGQPGSGGATTTVPAGCAGAGSETAASAADIAALCHARCDYDQRCRGSTRADCVSSCLGNMSPAGKLSCQGLDILASCYRDPACVDDDICEERALTRDASIRPMVEQCVAFLGTCPYEADISVCLQAGLMVRSVRDEVQRCTVGVCSSGKAAACFPF